MKANLRVFWLDLPASVGVHDAIQQCGITYKHGVTQTVADQTWLIGCEYPDDTILPPWFEPMEFTASQLRHWGIPEDEAKEWSDWRIVTQARRHQIQVRDLEIKRLTEKIDQLRSSVKELEDRLVNQKEKRS